jgi:hypothetical protein
MSNYEHLIENAVVCMEKGEDYEDFADAYYNRLMSAECDISLQDIWRMASYVVFTLKPSWVSDTVAYFQCEELFDKKMKEYIERFI